MYESKLNKKIVWKKKWVFIIAMIAKFKKKMK